MVPGKAVKTAEIDEDLRRMLETSQSKIKVVGIGGAGNNTISRLMQVGITGAEIIAVNTDAQDLLYTDADDKILVDSFGLIEEKDGVYTASLGILANGYYIVDIRAESIYGKIEVRTGVSEFSVGSN